MLPHKMTWYPFCYEGYWVVHKECGAKLLQCERIDGKIDVKCSKCCPQAILDQTELDV